MRARAITRTIVVVCVGTLALIAGSARADDVGVHRDSVAKWAPPSAEKETRVASRFGMVDVIEKSRPRTPPATHWWLREDVATDAASKLGKNMWAASLDDAAGGGLTLSGVGEGGGHGEGAVGLGRDVATIGGGDGDVGAFGHQHDRLAKTDPAEPTPMMIVDAEAKARAIASIVRANFGRFRVCYERGLYTNPTLQGRVAVKLVIDSSGAVAVASDGGSDLPDADVVSCVVRSFANLAFPEPGSEFVTVLYPLVFTPGTPGA